VRGPGDTATSQWTLLDWTSPPLHRLNDKAGLRVSALYSEARVDYVQFFVSYLGGSEERDGLIHPFLIPDIAMYGDGTELYRSGSIDENFVKIFVEEIFAPTNKSGYWAPSDEDKTSPALQDFKDFPAPQGLTLFKGKDFAYDLPPDADRDIDPFDIPEEHQPNPPEHAEAESKLELTKSAREIVGDFFKKNQMSWFEGAKESKINEVDEKPVFQLTVPMIYRGALFDATLSVHRTGMILMESDDPVPGADWLSAPRWEVRRRPDGIRLLCLQAPRRLLDLDELRRDLATPGSKHSPDRIVKHHRRIEERIDWSRTIKRTLVFSDVEFMEEVVLDDSLFERSLEFHECRFMKGLRLKNTAVNGSLVLDRSKIEGAEKWPRRIQQPVKHSLDLRGLKVERLLSLDRLTLYGRTGCERAACGECCLRSWPENQSTKR